MQRVGGRHATRSTSDPTATEEFPVFSSDGKKLYHSVIREEANIWRIEGAKAEELDQRLQDEVEAAIARD